MAAYYSPFLLLSIFITLYLLLLSSTNMTSVEAVSFDFTQFQSGDHKELYFQGDAVVDDSNRCLVLTREEGGSPVQNSVGRVLYESPVLLFNAINSHEASFKTSFTFYNNRVNKDKAGDGLAFFLAPFNSKPKHAATGLLGIFPDSLVQSDEDEYIVAVEFDSFSNTWDPKDPHIGIDVHSITSKITKPWPLKNDYVTVSITYEPFDSFLNVSAFYRQNPTDVYTLSTKVNLKDNLPGYVRVGLSASTGEQVEQHRVYSWFFSSQV